jgi:hypothetical protein
MKRQKNPLHTLLFYFYTQLPSDLRLPMSPLFFPVR